MNEEDLVSAAGKPQLDRLLGLLSPRLHRAWRRVRQRVAAGASEGAGKGARDARTRHQKTFDDDALLPLLASLGIGSGDLLMVHSSWGSLSSYNGSPPQMIKALRGLVGTGGTLCMPVFPALKREGGQWVFDVRRTRSTSGLLTEVFRRTADARRSLQFRSIVAAGPAAGHLVGDHHLSPYASGDMSPYARLAEMDAKVLCLGVRASTNTLYHCAEDMLRERFPVSVHQPVPTEIRVDRGEGEWIAVQSFRLKPRWAKFCDAVRMEKYFDGDIVRHAEFHGVSCSVTDARRFLDRLLVLAGKKVHMYGFRFPSREKVIGDRGAGSTGHCG